MSGAGLGARASALGAVALLAARTAARTAWVRAVAAALLLGPIPIAYAATGDGSPAGRLRAAISWTADLGTVLLTLSAVFLTAGFASRLRRGELVTFACGPLSRVGLVAGWWVGSAATLAALTAVGAVSLAATSAATVALADADARPALAAARVAWARYRPVPPDPERLAEAVAARLDDLRRTGRIAADGGGDDLARAVEAKLRLDLRTVRPRQTISWQFDGLSRARAAEALVVRFRFRVNAARATGELTQPVVPGRLWFRPPALKRPSPSTGPGAAARRSSSGRPPRCSAAATRSSWPSPAWPRPGPRSCSIRAARPCSTKTGARR